MGKMEKKYLRSLREKHNMMHNTKEMKIGMRDVVLIKGEQKKQRKLKHQKKLNVDATEY